MLPPQKRKRTPEEIRAKCEQQLRFMNQACALYDQGDHEQAINIAARLRVLLHDNPRNRNSVSLLRQIGAKDVMRFIDSGIYRDNWIEGIAKYMVEDVAKEVPSHSPSEVGLVEIGFGPNGKVGWYPPLNITPRYYEPHLRDAFHRPRPFDEWWNTPLIETAGQYTFSRSELVMIIADKEGGHHVDEDLPGHYEDFVVDGLGTQMAFSNESMIGRPLEELPDYEEVANNVAFASVRQVAFEVVASLERFFAHETHLGIYAHANPYSFQQFAEPPHKPFWHPKPIVFAIVDEDE